MINNDDKIQGIIQSNSLDELPLKYLPPVSDTPDNYYFISYSHLDYKSVYQDIFGLQSQGVNVWYDRGMPAGLSWKETAEKYIRPSRCAGVVFYVSENSLLSPAIHEEIAFAKKCGKSCLTINLPLKQNGKTVSAKEMLDELIAQGKEVSKEKYDFICDTFNADVLYLPYSAEADVKAEKIGTLPKLPLLTIDIFYDEPSVIAVNDTDVTTVKESDFIRYYYDTHKVNIEFIGDCAFANCTLLQSIEIPKMIHVIGNYAFYNCRSLKSIDVSGVGSLGSCAFMGCADLREVHLGNNPKMAVLRAKTFMYCSSLEKVDIPQDVLVIENDAFSFSGIREISIPKGVKYIQPYVFDGCESLTSITVDKRNRRYSCLYNCVIEKKTKTLIFALSYCVLPNDGSIVTIDADAFSLAKEFSMLYYYKYCGDNHYYHHAKYGDIDIFNLGLPDNSIIIPQGVRVLKNKTFNGTRMCGIVLPDSIKEIKQYAFEDCDYLEYICYIGTMAQWNAIIKDPKMFVRSEPMDVRIQCLDGEILLEI